MDILAENHGCRNAGNGEQFEGKEFDRGFSFAVDEEVGIDDAMEDVGIADGWRTVREPMERDDMVSPTVSRCS